MRNKNLDTPETTCNDFITAFINDMDDESIDFIFLLHSTQPLVSQNTINNICDNLKTKKYDSAFTAKQYKQYSWYGGKPLNYDKYNIPRTQDINPVIIETTGLYVFSQEMYKKDRCRIGDMPYIKIVNEIEGIDIDTKEDFKLAKLICEGNYL